MAFIVLVTGPDHQLRVNIQSIVSFDENTLTLVNGVQYRLDEESANQLERELAQWAECKFRRLNLV